MKEYLDFHGKVAAITGGRRGLGRAMALAFAERGAHVAILARSPDDGGILKALEEAGTPGCYLPCDVSDPARRKGKIEEIVERFGRIDILVNNAGMQFKESIESCTWEQWEYSRSVLLDAPFDFSRQCVPHMKRQGAGKIINISSVCGLCGAANEFSYAVMKGGIVAMTRAMGNYLARFNIHVNAIAPGICRSDLTVSQGCFDEERIAGFANAYPMKRLGEAEEVAAVVLFLAGEMSSFISGQTIPVDGGFVGR